MSRERDRREGAEADERTFAQINAALLEVETNGLNAHLALGQIIAALDAGGRLDRHIIDSFINRIHIRPKSHAA